jgi:hypothetical protein
MNEWEQVLPPDWSINDYATHCRVLASALVQSDGPILELGAGTYSTPLIHHLAGRRPILTVDHNPAWLAKFAPLASSSHTLCVCPQDGDGLPEWNKLPYALDWSVALVDQSPACARVCSIAALADHCQWIVVHDTDCQTYYHDALLRQFKYRFDDKLNSPATTVISNRVPFTME